MISSTEKPSGPVLVAMSGGVDSSLAAWRLVQSGTPVVGAYMKNWVNEPGLGDCPWQSDIEDARAVADRLGIEFRVVNLMHEYRARIVDYLLAGYASGVTPNPDVMCNREIKFGVFLDYAQHHGFSAVATGHYARRRTRPDGRFELLAGCDPSKDQSYFLALLRQEQLARALFPVGDLLKSDVRRLAQHAGLPTATKKDSQGICFIGQIPMSDFLSQFLPDQPGPIVTLAGKMVGEHRGLHHFTLGQRKGLRVPSNSEGDAYVVVAKRPATRELVVGFDRPETPLLYSDSCTVGSLSWICEPLDHPAPVQVRPRYRAPLAPALFFPQSDARAAVRFDQPQRALAPGQICAFYRDDLLLGAGVFEAIDARLPAPAAVDSP